MLTQSRTQIANAFAARRWQELILLSLTILATIGCDRGATGTQNGDGQVRRIIFLANGDNPFWNTCRAGMDKAAEELNLSKSGLQQVMDKGSEFKVEKQLAKLEQYATQSDIAAIAISSTDADSASLARALKKLQERGVKIICVDADMNRDKFRDARFAYLGTNNFVAGQELGKAAKGLRPQGGKYATFVGLKTVANAIGRITGFADGAGDKFVEVDSLADDGNEDRAQENVKTVLKNHADVDTLVGIWEYNAPAIVRAVEGRRDRDKTTIVVFDAAELALADLKDGKIDAMVVQNPYQMGMLSVKLMKALVENDGKAIQEIFPAYDPTTGKFKDADGDLYETELRVVVPDEGSPLKAEMFRPETKFFHFNDFKKWLGERKLVSS